MPAAACSNRLTADGVRLAGARPAGRAGDRAAAVAAQGAAAQLRARPGHAPRRRCARSARIRGREPFTDALARELRGDHRCRPCRATPGTWRKVPAHLRMTFRVEDDRRRGARRGQGPGGAAGPARTDGAADRRAPPPRTSSAPGSRPGRSARCRRRSPASSAAARSRASPRWSTRASTVALRVLGSRAEADTATHDGVRRLLALTLPSPLKGVVGRLDNPTKLALGHNPNGSRAGAAGRLRDGRAGRADGPPRRAAAATTPASPGCRLPCAPSCRTRRTTWWWPWRGSWRRRTTCPRGSRGTPAPAVLPAWLDIRSQVARLVHPGFVTATGVRPAARPAALPAPRCSAGWTRSTAPGRDAERMARVQRGRAGARARGWPGCGRSGAATRTCGRCGGCWRSCGSACSPSSSARRPGVGEADLPSDGRGRHLSPGGRDRATVLPWPRLTLATRPAGAPALRGPAGDPEAGGLDHPLAGRGLERQGRRRALSRRPTPRRSRS